MKLLRLELITEDKDGKLYDFVLLLAAVVAFFYPNGKVSYEVKDAPRTDTP